MIRLVVVTLIASVVLIAFAIEVTR